MIKLTILVDSDNIIGVKEAIAEYLEKYGDTKVVEVQQIKTGGDVVEQTRCGIPVEACAAGSAGSRRKDVSKTERVRPSLATRTASGFLRGISCDSPTQGKTEVLMERRLSCSKMGNSAFCGVGTKSSSHLMDSRTQALRLSEIFTIIPNCWR